MFAFAGSQGTGKTTLAKKVAEQLKLHYHDASVSKIMREFGINAVGDIPIYQRLEAQEFLLEKFIDAIKAAPRPAITDRCPLDMIGYMLGEITMHNTPADYHERIAKYVQRCMELTVLHFDMVLILRPLQTYEIDPKRPPLNKPYQSLVQFIIEGAANTAEYLHSGVMTVDDLDERAEHACSAILMRMSDNMDAMKAFSVH